MDDILSDFSAAATNRLGGMYKCRDEDDCCAICFTSPIADVCHVQPCGHRLGCWSCVEPGLSTCRQCWLCREPVACIVRESTGEMWAVPPPPPSSLEPWDWLESETETEPEPEPGPRTFPAPRSATSLERQVVRRMYVYHHRLFSRHVGANRASGYREITPRVFRNDPALQARARAFLRRELRVFAHMAIHPGLRAARLPEDDIITVHEVEYDVRFFLFMLKKVDLKGSCGSAESYVQQRLARALENMRDRSTVVSLFIHELRAFLMSPHTRLGDWDASVQYDEPPSALAPVPRSDADRPDSTMAFEESCDEETARRRDLSPSNDWRESHDSTTTSEGSGSDRGVARRSFLTPRLSGRGPPNPASLSQRPGYQEAASRTPSTTAEGLALFKV